MNAIVPVTSAPPIPAMHDFGGQCLTFQLRGSLYAIGLAHVREIIEFGALTAVPRMPPFVRGVMNLRGAVLPVIDLGSRLGLGDIEVSRKTCVLIIEVTADSGALLIGAMVDAVSEVLDVPASEVQRAPDFGSCIEERFARGMVRFDDRFVILLDVSAVLSLREMARLSEGMTSP